MSSNDFRTGQVQTKQIIASGSVTSVSGAKLVIYPIEAQGAPENTGVIDPTKFNTVYLDGKDIFLYVSGGVGERGTERRSISVFGGDVHVSGNLSVAGFSGGGADSAASFVVLNSTASLPNERVLSTGTGLTMSDGGAGGNVTIRSTVTGVWIEGSPSPRLRTSASVAIGRDSLFAQQKGTDVFFYVSGTIGSITNASKSLFGGDVHVSGGIQTLQFNSSPTTDIVYSNTETAVIAGNTISASLNTNSLFGGNNVKASGNTNTIGFGLDLEAKDNTNSFILSYLSKITGSFGSLILGGTVNEVTNSDTVILIGGNTNIINNSFYSNGFGGVENVITNSADVNAIGGVENIINDSSNSEIIGGSNNEFFLSSYITLLGGRFNSSFNSSLTSFINSSYSNALLSTQNAFINTSGSGITGSRFSTIIASTGSYIIASTGSHILFGENQTISSSNNLIKIGGTSKRFIFSGSLFDFGVGPAKFNAGLSGSLQQTAAGLPYIIGTNISVSTNSNGQVVLSSSAGSPTDAQYLVLAADGILTQERIFTKGAGIGTLDGGAGGSYTISAALSAGPNIALNNLANGAIAISGTVQAPTGASYVVMSLDSTLTNERVLAAGNNISITDGGANGNVTITSLVSGTWLESTTSPRLRTSASVAIGGDSLFAQQKGADLNFYVSGNVGGTTNHALFGGDTFFSGGLTGSLQRTAGGLPYIIGTNISVSTNSNQQIVISSSVAAPVEASFLTLGTNATLQNERVFTPGIGIGIVDGGAGGTYTVSAALTAGPNITLNSLANGSIAITGSTQAPTGASYVVISSDSTLTNERVLTAGPNISIIDGGANSPVTIAVSNLSGVWIEGSPSPRIRTSASVAIGSDSLFAQAKGSDLNFYVSGNIGGTTNHSLFGGDVVVSGNFDALTYNSNKTTNTISSNTETSILSSRNLFISNTNFSLLAGISGSIIDNDNVYYLGSSSSLLRSSLSAIISSLGIISNSNGSHIIGGIANTIRDSLYAGTYGSYAGSIYNSTIATIHGGISNIVSGANISSDIFGGDANSIKASNRSSIFGSHYSGITGSLKSGILASSASNITNSTSSFILFADGQSISGLSNTIKIADSNKSIYLSGALFEISARTRYLGGLSGSIQRTANDLPYIISGPSITIATNSNGQIEISGSGVASSAASYVVLGLDSSLTNERVLTAGNNISITDGGANGNVTITSLVSGNWIESTTSPRLRTTASVAVGTDNLFAQQKGSDVFFYVSGNIGGTTNHALFGGDTFFSGGLTGSLQKTAGGLDYIIGGTGMNITTNSNQQVSISVAANGITDATIRQSAGNSVIGRAASTTGNVADITATTDGFALRLTGSVLGFGRLGIASIIPGSSGDWFSKIAAIGGDGVMEVGRYIDFHNSSSVAADFSLRLETLGTTTDLYINSTNKIWHQGNDGAGSGLDADTLDTLNSDAFVQTGSVNQSIAGNKIFTGGLSGSLQRLASGIPYITGGAYIQVNTNSLGQIEISGANPSPAASISASYVVMSLDGALTSERVLTASTGITITDGGANGNVTIGVSGLAPNTASYLVLGTDATLTQERVFTKGAGIGIVDGGAGGTYTVSAALTAGPNVILNNLANGSIAITASLAAITGTWIEGSPSPRIRTSASVAIGSETLFAEDKGTNVFFYVSGANNNTENALFGGDIFISGNVRSGITVRRSDVASSTSDLLLYNNNTHQIGFYARLGAGNYNPLVSADNKAMIFTNGTSDTGGMIIAPWAARNIGLKLTASGDAVLSSDNIALQVVGNTVLYVQSGSTAATRYVGIGTTSAARKLHVHNETATTTPILRLANNSADIDISVTTATPEGSITGSIGDIDSDATNGDLYVKKSGTATTAGWARLLTVNDIGAAIPAPWIEGSPSPRIRTTASVAIGSESLFAQQKGADLNFYVSGNIAGSTNHALFGGDVVVSGNLFVGGNESAAVLTVGRQGTTTEGGEIRLATPVTTSFSGSVVNVDVWNTQFRVWENGSPFRGAYLLANEMGAGITSKIWHSTNDGSGSGLDADKLQTYGLGASGDRWGIIPLVQTDGVMEIGRFIDFHNSDASAVDFAVRLDTSGSTSDLYISPGIGGGTYKVWNQGNDGAGSGLDADLLDNLDSAAFVQTGSVNQSIAGNKTFTGGLTGSLQRTAGGLSYIIGTNISVVTNSSQQIVLSHAVTGTWIEGSPSPRLRTSASVAIGSETLFAEQKGTDVFFYVSGTLNLTGSSARTALFGGDVYASGNITARSYNSNNETTTLLNNPLYSAIIGSDRVNINTTQNNAIIASTIAGISGTTSYANSTIIGSIFSYVTNSTGTGLYSSYGGHVADSNGSSLQSTYYTSVSTSIYAVGIASSGSRLTGAQYSSIDSSIRSSLLSLLQGSIIASDTANIFGSSNSIIAGSSFSGIRFGDGSSFNNNAIFASHRSNITGSNTFAIIASSGSFVTQSSIGSIVGAQFSDMAGSVYSGIYNGIFLGVSGGGYSSINGSTVSKISASNASFIGAGSDSVINTSTMTALLSTQYGTHRNNQYSQIASSYIVGITSSNYASIFSSVTSKITGSNASAIVAGSDVLVSSSILSMVGASQYVTNSFGTEFGVVLGSVGAGIVTNSKRSSLISVTSSNITSSLGSSVIASTTSTLSAVTHSAMMASEGSRVLSAVYSGIMFSLTSDINNNGQFGSTIIGGFGAQINDSAITALHNVNGVYITGSLLVAGYNSSGTTISRSQFTTLINNSSNTLTNITSSTIIGRNLTLSNVSESFIVGDGTPSSYHSSIFSSSLHLNRGFVDKVTVVTGNYQITRNDSVIGVSASSAISIGLYASPEIGRKFTVKDMIGSGALANITITTGSGAPTTRKIDGDSTYTIAVNYGSITLCYFGSNIWGVV